MSLVQRRAPGQAAVDAVMGVKSGGGEASPPVTNLGGNAPSRFENEVAQIRCIFRFLRYFGGRLATCRRFVTPTQKSVATPLTASAPQQATEARSSPHHVTMAQCEYIHTCTHTRTRQRCSGAVCVRPFRLPFVFRFVFRFVFLFVFRFVFLFVFRFVFLSSVSFRPSRPVPSRENRPQRRVRTGLSLHQPRPAAVSAAEAGAITRHCFVALLTRPSAGIGGPTTTTARPELASR